MLKVCVVNPNYYRSSGVTIALRRVYKGMAAQAVDQYFVDCGYGNQENSTDWIPSDRYFRFDLMTSRPAHLLKEVRRFVRWIKSQDIPIVHVAHRRLASILWLVQRQGNYRVIYTGQVSFGFSVGFWLASPSCLTAVSNSVADSLRSTTRHQNVEVINNPSEFPVSCPPADLQAIDGRVVYVARLDPVKGHEYLIAAWKLLKERGLNPHLLLVGEGGLEADLKRQVRDAGLEDRVTFRGFSEDVLGEVRQCLFAVLTSRVEGQALAAMEAAACGRPTLMTNVDGSRDCVPPDAQLPNLVPYGDAAALAEALAIWLQNPEQVIEEGIRFYNFHKGSSSIEIVAEKYATLYKQVVHA